MKSRQTRSKPHATQPRSLASYCIVGIVAVWMLVQLFFTGYRVQADTANEVMFTTVTAGILDIVSASTSNSFTGVNVSFSSQTATASDMGAIRVSDARGSGAGWSLTLAGIDWKGGAESMQLDYDGTGSDDNLGKMCLIVESAGISSAGGQGTSGITKGSLSCFSASVTSLSLYTASSSNGKGDYWIVDFALEQYIPSNPTAQSLTTTLTLTLS